MTYPSETFTQLLIDFKLQSISNISARIAKIKMVRQLRLSGTQAQIRPSLASITISSR